MNYFLTKPTQRLLEHKRVYFFAALFWTLLVLFLSLVSFKSMPAVRIINADKYVHFIFYFIFVILWFLYLKKTNKPVHYILIKIFFMAIFYGILIELAQSFFTSTRKGDVLDVLANSTGAITASIMLYILHPFFIKGRL